MLLNLINRWGRDVTALVHVESLHVKMSIGGCVVGVADRQYLHHWLRDPDGMFAYDQMAWMPAGNGIALAIDDEVPMWPLQDEALSRLRELV